MTARGANVSPGDFAENITTEGIELTKLNIADKIKIGKQVALQITQFEKPCQNQCEIFKQIGDCVMPTDGIFAKVIKPGKIKVGDTIEVIND